MSEFMRNEHKAIQSWISKTYGGKYKIEAEIIKTNYLPNKVTKVYQPDVIVRDKLDRIIAIIEIENKPVRKVIVGAIILADYSMSKINFIIKPRLIFIVYTERGIRQIKSAKKKIDIAQQYCSNLKSIKMYSSDEFKKVRI